MGGSYGGGTLPALSFLAKPMPGSEASLLSLTQLPTLSEPGTPGKGCRMGQQQEPILPHPLLQILPPLSLPTFFPICLLHSRPFHLRNVSSHLSPLPPAFSSHGGGWAQGTPAPIWLKSMTLLTIMHVHSPHTYTTKQF